MESGEQTQDEALARSRLELAKQELDKGHLERAEECAKEALEFDGQLNEARIWLADLYIAQAEPYLASRQLQDAIYTDRTDSVAWEKLKEVDPISAARMARLSELAPDPFVSHRVAELEDEFEDLGSEEEEAEEEYEEGSPWAGVTGAGQAAAELLEDFSDDEEETAEDDEDLEPEADSDHEVEVEAVAEITPATPPATAPAPPAGGVPSNPGSNNSGSALGPGAWEFEQDRQYLQRWLAEPQVQGMLEDLRDVWRLNEIKFMPAYDHAARMQRDRHPEIAAATEKCLHQLGLHDCELRMVVERGLHPVPITPAPPRLIIPTMLIKAMGGAELQFHLARSLEYIRAGYLPEYLVADTVADRPLRALGDESFEILRAIMHEIIYPHEGFLKKEEHEHLQKLAHAWQQRATLSADRAGWLCCGDLDEACLAIAKGSAHSLDEAAKITLEGFLEQFKGEDPAKLAAIPLKEIPDRSAPYAAYRIKMLQWWAKTPAGLKLREQFAD
ncbi:MAG: hypothetical protein GX100_13790 [candidate division WS1 bacterium]|nr:hypothetical protein [candidate division WS1 bacterium]